MPEILRGPILKSQCYGCAKDLVKAVPSDKLNSTSGASYVVNAVHKRNPMSFVTDIYSDFNALLTTRRQSNAKVKNFETRFEAQLSRFNAHGAKTIPESLLALMLLANAGIEDNQRVSILAASVNSSSADDENPPSVKDMLSQERYASITSVLRQCDRSKPTRIDDESSLNVNSANQSNNNRRNGGRGGGRDSDNGNKNNRNRQTRTPEEIAALKGQFHCHLCKKKVVVKYGHWSRNHNPDGSLKPGATSSDTPIFAASNQSGSNANRQSSKGTALGFTSSLVCHDTLHCNVANTGYTKLDAGPMVDDGAPFSAIGSTELQIVREYLPNCKIPLEPKPSELSQYSFWQYGNGTHASPKRLILGSVLLYARTNNGNRISIRHLVVDGPSQWIIGRNLTRCCNIGYIGRTAIRLPTLIPVDYGDMYDYDVHSHVKLDRFCESGTTLQPPRTPLAICNAFVANSAATSPSDWHSIRRIVDRLHKHVCGHASFSDIRTLLERSRLWNDQSQRYLAEVMADCVDCKAASSPLPNRRVSLSSLNRQFNDIVCLGHCFLDLLTIIHCMDVATRFSAGAVVQSTDMASAIKHIDLIWLSQFWIPSSFQADDAFHNDEFKSFMDRYGIHLRPVPSRRHYTLYAFEMAKGFTKPFVSDCHPIPVDEELETAHDELIAKRNLTLIMRSKTFTPESFKCGDLVQVFIKNGKSKRGKWTSPRTVLSIDVNSGTVTVTGRAGKTITDALEDTRAARASTELVSMIQDSIDRMDFNLVDCLDVYDDDTNNEEDTESSSNEVGNFCGSSSKLSSLPLPNEGDRISVFRPLDNTYYSGTVQSVQFNGDRTVLYDDDDVETRNLSTQQWKHGECIKAASSVFMNTLPSNEQDTLSEMLNVLDNRSFLRHQAQAYDQSVIVNAYSKEEATFLQNVEIVPRSSVPKDANIIGFHTIYKIKHNDDKSLKLKARIAPHGNEDSDLDNLHAECCMCPPIGIRIISITAALNGWRVIRADAETAFLQTGPAKRLLYVIPPAECVNRRNFLRLLMTAAYGLVNSNAKWQRQSDDAFLSLGLEYVDLITQLFVLRNKEKKVVIMASKMVDDILITGEDDTMRHFINSFNSKFKLGEVVPGP